MRRLTIILTTFLLLSLGSYLPAQEQADQPLYKLTINVVERTAKAVNYRHRAGSTTIGFRGTPLLAQASGEAKVESKQGYIEIEVEFDELEPATRFGPEYLTYVMWAVTPEGRATNLGEVILNGNRSKLNVTTELQAFGLIVTAEPYFAVTQPSDVVVMENYIRNDTRGDIQEIDAKYELLKRGQYTVNVPPAELKPLALDDDIPLDLYQARNAVRIAEWAKADVDAADTFTKAQSLLEQAEAAQSRDESRRAIAMPARQAVQTAEDARLIALQRQEEARLAEERSAAAARESEARAAADAEAKRRAQAQQQQQLEAERRARAEAETAAVEARARAEAERAARERAEIEAEANRAREEAQQAELEKEKLRKQLVEQLNLILETRDTARGLVVNMSDVLFDTGKYTLKPGAREKLARVAGIVLAYPGLTLEIEGHTDTVGSEEYNQTLSEQRATSVRDFLVHQGIRSPITVRGMGEHYPVVSNDTAAGRQQNRRVEMIVSGDVIGVPLSPQTSNPR